MLVVWGLVLLLLNLKVLVRSSYLMMILIAVLSTLRPPSLAKNIRKMRARNFLSFVIVLVPEVSLSIMLLLILRRLLIFDRAHPN